MGVLDRLKSKAAEAVAQRMPQQRPTRPTPGIHGAVTLEGARSVQVYTYDGRPFNGMKVGDWFYADVLPGDCILDGPEASGPLDTSTDPHLCVLCANGVPFGFAGLAHVKQIAQSGFAVRVRIEKVGMYSRAIPDLEAFVPEWDVIEKWWTLQQSSPAVIPFGSQSLEGEDGEDIPEPSPLSSVDGQHVALVDVFMPSIRMAQSNKAVNRTVTLPAWLNALAVERGVNFSQTLQKALRDQLHA